MSRVKFRVGIAGYGVVGKRRKLFIDQQSALQTVAATMENGFAFGTWN